MADNVEAEQKERYIDTVNPDDPELERESRRPANIKADMKDMERSKRVSLILNSQAFREELEAIIETQLKVRIGNISVHYKSSFRPWVGNLFPASSSCSSRQAPRGKKKIWNG